MIYRQNISIKTKYKTINECRENSIDKVGKATFSSTIGKSLIGEILPNNSFVIGSNQKSIAVHQFVGEIVESDDGIYMVGDIKERPLSLFAIYFSVIFGLIFGVGMILTWNPVLMLFGLLFMIVPSFNIIHIKRSNGLYNKIFDRVS